MKNKVILSAILSILIVWSIGASLPETRPPIGKGQYLFTAVSPWLDFRTPATETGSAAYDFTAANGSWAEICVDSTTITATNGVIDVMGETGGGWGGNGIEIAFFSEDDTADDSFGFELFAFADSLYGPAIPVYATGTTACAVGTRTCTTHPITGVTQASGLWVDTIDGTDYWGGITVLDSGTNHIARIMFDMRGYRYFWLRIIGSHGTKIGAVYKLW
jgi:hypothetical protein